MRYIDLTFRESSKEHAAKTACTGFLVTTAALTVRQLEYLRKLNLSELELRDGDVVTIPGQIDE
jgi:hypothetical protein